jgi:hypothetical protein
MQFQACDPAGRDGGPRTLRNFQLHMHWQSQDHHSPNTSSFHLSPNSPQFRCLEEESKDSRVAAIRDTSAILTNNCASVPRIPIGRRSFPMRRFHEKFAGSAGEAATVLDKNEPTAASSSISIKGKNNHSTVFKLSDRL